MAIRKTWVVTLHNPVTPKFIVPLNDTSAPFGKFGTLISQIFSKTCKKSYIFISEETSCFCGIFKPKSGSMAEWYKAQDFQSYQ